MTVGTLLRTMSSAELSYWIAFSRVEPFGQIVDDYRAGLSAAMYVNVKRSADSEPIAPNSLMPWNEAPAKEVPPDASPDVVSGAVIDLFDQMTRGHA